MENFDEIYTELFAAIRESPGLAQETVDTLQRIIIGKEQVHVCAHCEQLFTADDTPAHMMTCEKNPVVLENKRLRAELDIWERKSKNNGLAAMIGLERMNELEDKNIRSQAEVNRLRLQNAALRGEATYWRDKYLKTEAAEE